VKKLYSKKDT